MQLYKAMVQPSGSGEPLKRVEILAESLKAAMEKLEAEHGKGNVFNLHNQADAAKLRIRALLSDPASEDIEFESPRLGNEKP